MTTTLEVIPSRSVEQMEAELQWIAAMLKDDITPPSTHASRKHGKYSNVLVQFYITGEMVTPYSEPTKWDLEPMLNLYASAPPHVKEVLDPILEFWKIKIFGGDDLIMNHDTEGITNDQA